MENQTTKLDKAVKISLILGILIVALSAAYYLIYFLPNKDRVKESSRKDCAAWAIDKAKQKYENSWKNGSGKYDTRDYDNYFERCLREKGL